LGFEGGQLPLIKKLPSMRGFTNIFRTEYQVVNVGSLADLPAGSDVTLTRLAEMSLIKAGKGRVKLLGRGEIDVALIVEAHASSQSARGKIEAAGGSVRELD
jgi:large subunit ribosomal protein L15